MCIAEGRSILKSDGKICDFAESFIFGMHILFNYCKFRLCERKLYGIKVEFVDVKLGSTWVSLTIGDKWIDLVKTCQEASCVVAYGNIGSRKCESSRIKAARLHESGK